MTLQRLVLALWVLAALATILATQLWIAANPFNPHLDRIAVWESSSWAILVVALGNLFSPVRASASKAMPMMWTPLLILMLLIYMFYAIRSLLPAISHAIPLGETVKDTMWVGIFLKATLTVLVGKMFGDVCKGAENT